MKIAQMVLLGCVISGCAAAPVVTERAVDEKLSASIEHRLDVALESGKDPGKVWAEYGEFYMQEADKHPENAPYFKRKATSAFLISAQYGNNTAREVLRLNKIPVPEAVLKE